MTEDRALPLVQRIALVLAMAGIVGTFYWRGWAGAAGFAIGSAISILNLKWWERFVNLLGTEKEERKTTWAFAMRYVILGAVVYAIVTYLRADLGAILAGLLTAAAAVLLELLYEIFYART